MSFAGTVCLMGSLLVPIVHLSAQEPPSSETRERAEPEEPSEEEKAQERRRQERELRRQGLQVGGEESADESDAAGVSAASDLPPASRHTVVGAFQSFYVEKDVPLQVRDGAVLMADVFRPQEPGTYPAIVTLGPYPKDIPFEQWNPEAWETVPDRGDYMHWETVNPEWWVPQGYVVVRVDARGTGKSKAAGRPRLLARGEAEDFFDVIEWAAERGWSNGKVAVMGISYFAITAWRVAALDPPALAAVVPWEGAQDLYGDISRHGGIRSNTFAEGWIRNTARYSVPDAPGEPPTILAAAEEIRGAAVLDNNPDLAAIRAPLLSAANWGGVGLHLRGNIDGFEQAGSENKMLRVHVGNHVDPFYSMEGRLLQKRFLDHWLKGLDTGIDREPPVKLAIRLGDDRWFWRYENEWPLARTEWRPYYLDAGGRSLDLRSPGRTEAAQFSSAPGRGRGSVAFTTAAFEQRTEITGPAKLKLWVSSTADDADLFVVVRNLDADGREVTYPGSNQPELAAAYGWLRVSHRKLDRERSRPYRPVHSHDELEKLAEGEIVPVEIEILPTSFVLERGHRLVVEVRGEDDPRVFPFTHTDLEDRQLEGQVSIHAGGEHDSHLLVPVIPSRP
jgi:predicted acyl esterase